MRKKIVAGNWKMNKNLQEGILLIKEIKEKTLPADVVVVIATPNIHLEAAHTILATSPNIHVGAQNCHHKDSGAYTGEVSASILVSVGVEYVIVGHSERREYAKETNALIAQKVNQALANGLIPIYCCGESLPIREKQTHLSFVSKQIKDSLFHLANEDFKKVVIAYEPIWAIGTGLTASPEQAQEMHEAIRKSIAKKFGQEIANATPILYGGSCNATNAKSIFSKPDVDGGLIGGASLKAADFATIIQSF